MSIGDRCSPSSRCATASCRRCRRASPSAAAGRCSPAPAPDADVARRASRVDRAHRRARHVRARRAGPTSSPRAPRPTATSSCSRLARRPRPGPAARPPARPATCSPAPPTSAPDRVTLARGGGLELDDRSRRTGRSSPRCSPACAASSRPGEPAVARPHGSTVGRDDGGRRDADARRGARRPTSATMDLAEAPRIVGGGAGLDGAGALRASSPRVGAALGAVDGRDPRDHRPRLGRPRTPDRHHRRRRRPRRCTSPSASAARCSTPAASAQPDHIISVNTDPHCPMMQLADLADRRRRQRRRSTSCVAGWPRPADVGEEPATDVDVDRRRRRAGRLVRGDSCSPAPGMRVAAARARAVPRQQEHVRRRGLPAHPRRAASRVVGGGADPAVGHPPLDDDARPTRRRSPSTSAPRRGAQPPYNGATAYRPDFDHWLAGKAEAAGAELVCSTTATGLLRDGAAACVGVRTDRPDGDLTRPRRDRLRRRQLLPRQGGRPLRPRRRRATTRSA